MISPREGKKSPNHRTKVIHCRILYNGYSDKMKSYLQ